MMILGRFFERGDKYGSGRYFKCVYLCFSSDTVCCVSHLTILIVNNKKNGKTSHYLKYSFPSDSTIPDFQFFWSLIEPNVLNGDDNLTV